MIRRLVAPWFHTCPAPELETIHAHVSAPDPPDVGQHWECPECGRAFVVQRWGWSELPWERHLAGGLIGSTLYYWRR